MNYILVANKKPIVIGRQGENGVTTVRFSLNAFFPRLTDADYHLVHQRPGDVAPYPVETITTNHEYVEWIIRSEDLGEVGNGMAQLNAYVNDAIAKSVIFTTVTLNSLGYTEPPSPTPFWVDQVFAAGRDAAASARSAANSETVALDAKNNAESARDDAQHAKELAEAAEAGAASAVNDALAAAKASGEFDGFSPIAEVEKEDGVATITITDANGTTSATVSDGEGVPAGGTAGQILAKSSDEDFATTWATLSSSALWCTYDETTSAQIEAAYQAGLPIFCVYDDNVYVLAYRGSATDHRFTCVRGALSNVLSCLDSTWTSNSTSLAALASPTFTGTPAAPTASAGTNTTQIATTAFVQGEKQIYWATYGTTTSAQLETAYQASKEVLCIYNSYVYRLVYRGGSASHTFAYISTNTLHTLMCASGSWSSGSLALAANHSPVLTGTPSAPTASSGTNTTQIATTAFVQGEIAGLAPLASPTFTGTPAAPTATTGDSSTQIATTAFVQASLPTVPTAYTSTPAALGTASAGSSTSWARGDHVHPLPTDLIVVQRVDSSAVTIAGGSSGNATIQCNKTGYTPIGIVGVVKNPTPDGANTSQCQIYEFQIKYESPNYYALVHFRNFAGSQAKMIVSVDVLYRKN